jgi:hypothetical protein
LVKFNLSFKEATGPPIACVALVTSKSVFQSTSEKRSRTKCFSKISSLSLLVSFVPSEPSHIDNLKATLLRIGDPADVDWAQGPRAFESFPMSTLFSYMIQHTDCTTTNWVKLNSGLMPIEWAGLLQLTSDKLPLVFCPSEPTSLATDLMAPVTSTHNPERHSFGTLQAALLAAQQQLPLLKWQPGESVTFSSACLAYGINPCSQEADVVVRAIAAHMRLPKRNDQQASVALIDTPIVIKHFWICAALISPSFATDFARTLSVNDVTLAFLTHISLHGVAGRLCAQVQGVVGSGKTYTCCILVFLAAVFANMKILWTSHNNKPLEEAAEHLQFWLSSASPLHQGPLSSMFKRLPASDQPARYNFVDVAFENSRVSDLLVGTQFVYCSQQPLP